MLIEKMLLMALFLLARDHNRKGVKIMKNSVLNDLYVEGVVCKEVNGALVPSKFTDVTTEYNIFRHGIALVDGIGYAMLKIEGDNVIEEIDALVTKDIRYLNSGKIAECFFLNENAEALGISYIVNDDDIIIVLVPPENTETITTWLKEKLDDSLSITDMTVENHLLFIEGEKSWKVAKEVFDFPIETLPLREMVKVEYFSNNIMLSRIGRSGEYGYAMIGSHDAIHSITEHLLNTYIDNLAWCGTEAMSVCMLEVNQPLINDTFVKEGNIFELAYQWFVQFDKEDYYGRDVLMTQFEEKLTKCCVGFVVKEATQIDTDSKVYLEDELVGKVIYNKYDPTLNGVLGYLLLDIKVAVSGIPLTIKDINGTVTAITVSSPFVRPLSWDSQME
jgi:aminomethyltransferase